MEEGWQEGPFVKGHFIYAEIYNKVAKDLFEPFIGVSRVYEGFDTYGGFWATYGSKTKADAIRAMEAAHAIRKRVNDHFGFSIVAKPEFHEAHIYLNPYTDDAIFLCLVPKSVADRNNAHNGDAMVGALAACVEAGITVNI